MPIESYFKGHGRKVMANMISQYGKKKAKQVFYATANKKQSMRDHLTGLKTKGKLKASKSY